MGRRKRRVFSDFFEIGEITVLSGHRSKIGARRERARKRRVFSDFFEIGERTLVSRKKSLAIFYGRRRVFSDFLALFPGPFRKRTDFPRLACFSQGHRSEIGARRVFFIEPYMARQKNLSHKWLGKKILPFLPISILFPLPKEEEKIRLFSFGKKDQKSEERPSPQIPLESEGTRSRGKYRKKGRRRKNRRSLRKSHAIF